MGLIQPQVCPTCSQLAPSPYESKVSGASSLSPLQRGLAKVLNTYFLLLEGSFVPN